ncbi:TRAP transporter substrate-binding protein [Pseudovibrio sp. SPO723]|uniref:TRAP transporter substrate-binding protein n=1 Tax=Nesiotobacter zosterae TaxID=392721 RepID=UPI0029C5BD58|nr:TRAP transporter substrate-binding protein [Pseudovibrio sp. SPO723]MDX5594111.1 TRAP transporter substrate-binding protein [Pseudovibrio sp. SPO723]
MTEEYNKNGMTRRQTFSLVGAGAVAGTALAAPALAQEQNAAVIEWKMVTSWPKGLPGPGLSAQRVCDRINTMSNGRMRVRLYAAGELVPAFEVFDAVSGGVAQMGHSASFYWQGKMPASVFFTTVPFGLTPEEHNTWIEYGGGQELWDRLYAPFGVKPFMAGNTAGTMAGWFKKPVTSLEDLMGLKIRIQGLGGEIMRRLGATPVSMASSEIYAGFESGVVDAVEFLGPWSDAAMGFQQVSKHYYGPGFNKPNGTGEALISAVAFEGLSEDLRLIVEEACRSENAQALAEANWMNAQALEMLSAEEGIKTDRFPEAVVTAMRQLSAEVLEEYASKDELTAQIFESYRRAMAVVSPWSDLSSADYLMARRK